MSRRRYVYGSGNILWEKNLGILLCPVNKCSATRWRPGLAQGATHNTMQGITTLTRITFNSIHIRAQQKKAPDRWPSSKPPKTHPSPNKPHNNLIHRHLHCASLIGFYIILFYIILIFLNIFFYIFAETILARMSQVTAARFVIHRCQWRSAMCRGLALHAITAVTFCAANMSRWCDDDGDDAGDCCRRLRRALSFCGSREKLVSRFAPFFLPLLRKSRTSVRFESNRTRNWSDIESSILGYKINFYMFAKTQVFNTNGFRVKNINKQCRLTFTCHIRHLWWSFVKGAKDFMSIFGQKTASIFLKQFIE